MKQFFKFSLFLTVVALTLPYPLLAEHLEKIHGSKTLNVCHWPAYYGISFLNNKNGSLEGIDIDLAGELAKDLGVTLQFVNTSFAAFIEDLQQDRCDIAMFGVGITPKRKEKLDFSTPYLKSDIYAVTTKTHQTMHSWEDMDHKGHIIVVQKGTYMEDAATAFKNASILSVTDFQQREKEVHSGRADAFLTDYPYGKKILSTYDWARLMAPNKPFYEINYAYAVKKGDRKWLTYVNNFVERIKKDGRLKKYAEKNGLLPIAYLQ